MIGKTGSKDAKEARAVAVALIVLVIALAIGAYFAMPMLAEFNQTHLAPGIGLKAAAVWAFLATMVVLIVFAVAAGDGLLGELQFMLVGFFAFFLVLWLLIAWAL
ncbi:hypothetical protein [uncultured Marinobacter sp.]|uniref:hypothetical protein n=1 Tax=uncultured Marinobacter sp. TaxID=187379 RepID=UPI0030D88CEF|tara:strand:+ start:606 stop:920 length:315 start_codon:yes stop_codon:yes gene_type:complete